MTHLSILVLFALVRSSSQVRMSRSVMPYLGEKQFEDIMDIPAPPQKLFSYLKRAWGDMNSKLTFGTKIIEASPGAKAGKLAVGEFRHLHKVNSTSQKGYMLQQITQLNDDNMTFSWAAEPKDLAADVMKKWALRNQGTRFTVLPRGNASRLLREDFYDLDEEKAKKAFEEKVGGFGTFISRLFPHKTRNAIRAKINEIQNSFKTDHAHRAMWIKSVVDGIAAMKDCDSDIDLECGMRT
eukprot:gnl/TRDRNA2_/TRDRNA2_176290_c8_seq7.p1 gnl/TRDRNA2_/TRDRNA2_176290_c8~~gnl/TRDRNA2_/TRDRNA2_176290_c8_seq7.p1  ORF type:complete len:239 (-),score=34.71 gnl/TRDRNA2_/TRDRNA2_176290_c8_seq7:115-831(-)